MCHYVPYGYIFNDLQIHIKQLKKDVPKYFHKYMNQFK